MATKAPVVVRNGVSKQFEARVFGNRSTENKGKTYFRPILDVTDPNDVRWLGVDDINVGINKVMNQVFASIAVDADNYKDGVLDMNLWMADAIDCTAGRVTLSDLQELIDDLTDEMTSVTQDDKFGERVLAEGMSADAMSPQELQKYPLTADGDTLQRKAFELGAKIKPLRAKYKAIVAKYEARAAARKAKTEVPA